jgi:hypothetical protein
MANPICKHIAKPSHANAQPKACQRAYKASPFSPQGLWGYPPAKKQNKFVLCDLVSKDFTEKNIIIN